MRVSKRFPMAIHSLLYVAVLSKQMRVTSTLVADSIGSNPVIVRNLFLDLSKNGLLVASAGKNGGVTLAKEPKDMTLWDVYQAVESNDVEDVFKIYEGNVDCLVGKNIYQLLYPHMESALEALSNNMNQITIQTLLDELNTKI
ncbi:MAG: Rrf2 family transcriptional regulator [Erysipelotrichaceae bacterium]|nr:Rrf2 family transcriptional regulator [Erysipelotrichaceae bacterium]